jgi:hypothetical protein
MQVKQVGTAETLAGGVKEPGEKEQRHRPAISDFSSSIFGSFTGSSLFVSSSER